MCRQPSLVIALALLPACFSPAQVAPTAETEGGEATATTSATSDTAGKTESGPGPTGSTSGEGTTLPTDTTDTEAPTDTETAEESSTGGLVCDGPLVACGRGACEVDLTLDPLNCGKCGHDCLGGECEAGECQPVSLYVEGDLRDLAADEDYVYFITAGTVERIPQEVMADAEVLADDGPKPGPGKREIEATAEGLVFTGGLLPDGFVRLIGLDGARSQDLGFDATYNTPTGVTTTSSRAFWVGRLDGHPNTYAVLGTTLDGAGDRTYSSGLDLEPTGLAANNAFVYFTDQSLQSVQRRPVGGGQLTTILSDVSSCGIAPTEDRVFLSCRDLKGVRSLVACDLDGSNQTTLLTEDSPFFDDGSSLAFADGRIVWWDLEGDGNHLRDIGEDGSDPRTLYSTPVAITNARLVVAPEAYFFAEDATIRMLAR